MRDWASELRAIADGRLMLNVRNGVTVSRSMLAMIADEIDALRAAPLTPAEVGGHADAQTEARAIARKLQDVIEGHSWRLNIDKATDIIATALAAKDAELAEQIEVRDNAIDDLQQKWWFQSDRAERAEAQLAEANRKIEERDKALANYDRWLNGRDAYIVQKGLWQNFVASLPGSPTARRALEAQGGENG